MGGKGLYEYDIEAVVIAVKILGSIKFRVREMILTKCSCESISGSGSPRKIYSLLQNLGLGHFFFLFSMILGKTLL
jgi:hypothetical protein